MCSFNLEQHPDQLSEGAAEPTGLPLARNVDVHLVLALELVVLQVVPLKRHRRRNSHWNIGKQGPPSVDPDTIELALGH